MDSQKGRDVEILMPLIYFIEKHLNCEVIIRLIWDLHAIYRIQPDVVLLANTVGSKLHFEASKYAYNSKIKVFALISEGNFRTNGTFDYWGYNTDKNFFQEYICNWSDRTLQFLKEKEPNFAHKMVLTGGLGFDRYTIYEFSDKETFLKPYKLERFKKVIGYAGWAFGKLYNKQGMQEMEVQNNPERYKWIESQMCLIEDILKKSVENNPDILFILKRHPNEANPSITRHDPNEMVRLKDLPNVLYLHGNENIHDIISVSDIWTGFETTTCLEAWLMGKRETILLNPDPDFNRDELYKGSLIARDYEAFQMLIDTFYQNKKIEACHEDDMRSSREDLIHKTIGFSDGLNHLRAGYYFKDAIEKARNLSPLKKVKFHSNFFLKSTLMHIGKYVYNNRLFLLLPKFKKTVWIFENYNFKEFFFLKKKYFAYLDAFYKSKGIEKKLPEDIFWKNIIH